MVHFTRIVFSSRFRNYMREGIRDSLRIYVAGGCGGNGLPKFGGVGGNGGSVKLVSNSKITLDQVYKKNRTKQYTAKNGMSASHNFILGPPGGDTVIEVPVGVSIQTELGKHLGELDKDKQELVVAKGGTGGHSKNGYIGTKGQMYPVILDLKLIADIGLVGFPNAGKSTLLNKLSNSRAKVASYPFTTIKPNVGTIDYTDLRQITIADLPGLIEGAHFNKGMGHNFLKHVERTKLLLFVVDINGFQLSPQYDLRNCLETILLLNKEIEMYNASLLNKPAMLIINKMDTEGADQKYNDIKDSLKQLSDVRCNLNEEMLPKQFIKFSDIIAISAKENKDDIKKVKTKLRLLLDVFADLQNKALESENAEAFHSLKDQIREKNTRYI